MIDLSRKLLTALLLVAAALSFAGCADNAPTLEPSAPQASQPAATPASDAQYQLGSGDKIRVIVFGEKDLSGEFVVGDSGSVDMPLIGAVPARGASIVEFQSRMVKQLRNGYLNDPKVSVEVLNYRPFFITGEVKNGGEYPYKAGLSLQDAVGVAGGYSYRAETSYAYVRRAGEDHEFKVSLASRVLIGPGDSVRIPERFF